MALHKDILFNELLNLGEDELERLINHLHAVADIVPELQSWAEDRQLELAEERIDDWDGQPDALQEWHDFDPDCQEVMQWKI